MPIYNGMLWGGLDLAILEYAEYICTPEQPSKTSKTGHFGVLRSNSSDYCLNCEKIKQSDCQEEEKRMTKYMCFQSILLITIYF